MSPSKIKVLHVIKTLSLGGAETNLYNLVRASDPGRTEVHVAYSYGGEIEKRFRESGLRLYKYADGSHKIKSWASVWIIAKLARYILKHDIQIVHTHIFNAHVWGGLAARLTGRKVVEHVHDFRYMDREDFLKRRGRNNQFRFVGAFKNLSDRVIVLTRENRDFILRHRFHLPEKIAEIQNGIPLSASGTEPDREGLRLRFGVSRNRRVVLTSARISAEKNLDLIFRIVPRIVERVPEALFLVSGDGPLLESASAQCRRLGLERHLRFLGYQDRMEELLTISDLFLLPSFLELHSIAVLEAMSREVPVLVSAGVGCHDEFIRSWDNGVLLDPFSDEGWVEAVVRLLQDEGLRRKVGQRGYETCRRRFDIRSISKKIEDLYAELVLS